MLWIQDLLADVAVDIAAPRGLDMSVNSRVDCSHRRGCGATAIYSLLCARILPACTMTGTGTSRPWRGLTLPDVDSASLKCAQRNVTINQLAERIAIRRVGPSEPMFSTVQADEHV